MASQSPRTHFAKSSHAPRAPLFPAAGAGSASSFLADPWLVSASWAGSVHAPRRGGGCRANGGSAGACASLGRCLGTLSVLSCTPLCLRRSKVASSSSADRGSRGLHQVWCVEATERCRSRTLAALAGRLRGMVVRARPCTLLRPAGPAGGAQVGPVPSGPVRCPASVFGCLEAARPPLRCKHFLAAWVPSANLSKVFMCVGGLRRAQGFQFLFLPSGNKV